jgi:uncharacterized protein YfaT (DUF1175 family)
VNLVSKRETDKIGLQNVGDECFCNILRESLVQSSRNPAILSIVLSIFLSGCWKSSEARIESINKSNKSSISLIGSDADRDGIPDAAELLTYDDRASFRRWFTSIAEMQFYKVSDAWTEEQRDCAGLVRFAWREALRRHDRLWFQAMGEGYEAVAPDVSAYTLDRSPLGEKLFRIDYGSYAENDATFSEFADARTLKNHNTIFISRDHRRAQPGDLLFFHQPWAQKFPYHVMIYLGEARHASEGAADWVVYHTGSSSSHSTGSEGEVKKVRLSILNGHPDKRWRPVEKNRNFLGFYRLKILE